MSLMTGLTRSGAAWTPHFIVALNPRLCIGCGRCFKVCSRDVFALVERNSVIAATDADEEEWEDDGFSDDVAHVMTLANPGDCIGCISCSKVCPKRCQKHAPMTM
ncbi:MAG: ferredoxin III, nif-specific [Magnetococcales bacterium]|nr:ferredoxin III, nif-specific [Magnetococcales bacterium]